AFTGTISDASGGRTLGLTKVGSGTFTLGGSSNSYTGPTTISAGTLLAGAANATSPNSALTVAGTFNLGGFSQSIGSLTGNGTVTTTGSTGTDILTVGNDNTPPAAFTGSLTNGPGATRLLGLTKIGSGKLTLGSSSDCAGPVTVSGGT